MRADNSRHIVAAARRRAEQARQRAITTLRRMDATGQRKGSRQWTEGFVKPTLGLDYNLGDQVGTLYGRF